MIPGVCHAAGLPALAKIRVAAAGLVVVAAVILVCTASWQQQGWTSLKALGKTPAHLSHVMRTKRREVSSSASEKCYIAGGKEVPCSKLAQLGKLLKNVYGKEAADVALVSKDHAFDPTKIYPDRKSARKSELQAKVGSVGTRYTHALDEDALVDFSSEAAPEFSSEAEPQLAGAAADSSTPLQTSYTPEPEFSSEAKPHNLGPHIEVHGNHNTIALGGQDATAKSTVIIKGKNPGCGCCEHAACACCSVSMPEVVAVEQDSEQARGPATKTSTHMGLKGKKNVPFKPEKFPVHPNLHLSASFSKTHGYANVVAKHRRFELRMALRKRQFKAQKQQFKAHLAGTRRESASASKKNSKKNGIALSLNRKNQLKRGSAGVSRGMHPAANAAHAQEVQPPAERPRRKLLAAGQLAVEDHTADRPQSRLQRLAYIHPLGYDEVSRPIHHSKIAPVRDVDRYLHPYAYARGGMIAARWGYVGGASWLVIVLALGFLFFILIVVCAKKDSWVRAITYTLGLLVLFIYIMWWHLVPEIQKFHNLVPADCLIAGAPVLVDYNEGLHQANRSHSAFFRVARSSGVVAHIPVNVSHIVCHGQTGHGIEMTDMQGQSNFNASLDKIYCQEGELLDAQSTAYVKIDNWRRLDADEREDALNKYVEGKNFFCWVDPRTPGYVTFTNDQDWSAIFYPLACVILVIFLCWAAGSCALCSACFHCCLTDPWFLRIDASTPVSDLRRRHKSEYDHLI